MVGGFGRLGMPDDEREWSLEGRKNKDREVENMTCSECFATHAPARYCPECNHAYPVKQRAAVTAGRTLEEVDVELEEIDLEAQRRERRQEQARADTLQELIQLATSRNYKSPEKWAAHIWSHRQAKAREMNEDHYGRR